MPRIKEVHLRPFEYPHNGQMAVGDCIIVQAPTFQTIRIHRAMEHAIAQALLGLSKHSHLQQESDDKPKTLDADGNEIEEDNSDKVLGLFALAIEDEEKFQAICDRIQKIMTNTPSIARVAGTDAGITDACWREIGKTNGIEGVTKVMSTFTSFFLQAEGEAPSPSVNGSDDYRTSASPRAVESILQQPRVSRLGS